MLQSGENASWVLNDNYVLFENLEPDGSGALAVNSAKVSSYGFWSGFQLIEKEAPPPPPSMVVHYNITVATVTSLEGPAGGAGDTWNQGNGNGTDLLDSTGEATGIGCTVAGDKHNLSNAAGTIPMLLNGYWTWNGDIYVLTLTGLNKAKTYDFYLTTYMDYNSYTYKASHSTPNSTTSSNPQVHTQNVGDNLAWELNANYVLFEKVVPDPTTGEFTITTENVPTPGHSFICYSGFQLVENVTIPAGTMIFVR